MRIKKLVFQNINSLYGTWEIDFENESFRNNGLFAITGKTGSGKSTILDAMTLALYGVTPRLNRNASQAFSKGCSQTMSALTFADNNNDEWTVRYSSEMALYQRGKRSGEPRTVVVKHTLSCNGRSVANTTTSVKKKIEEVTGLDDTRFCRAVLLAQGSFDAFLEGGRKNSEILERITGTGIYSVIAAKVGERHDAEKGKLARLSALCEGIRIMSESDAALTEHEAVAMGHLIAEKNAQQRALTAYLKKFEELDRHRQVLEYCSAAQAQLLEEEKAFAPARQRFEEGKKVSEADTLYQPFQELTRQQSADVTALEKNTLLLKDQQLLAKKKEEELAAAQETLQSYLQEFAVLSSTLTAVRTLDTQVKNLSGSCSAALAKRSEEISRALKIRSDLKQVRADLLKLTQEHRQAAAYLTEYAGDSGLAPVRTSCQEKLEELQKIAAEEKACMEQVSLLIRKLQNFEENLAETCKKLEEDDKLLEEAGSRNDSLGKKLEELLEGTPKERWQELYEAREKCYRQALLLRTLEDHRKKLREGEPCPLCGSLDHPYVSEKLAEPEEEEKELEALKKRLAAVRKTEEELRKLAGELNALTQTRLQHENLLNQVQFQIAGKKRDLDTLTETLKNLENSRSMICQKICAALEPFAIVWNRKKAVLPPAVDQRIREFARCSAANAEFESKARQLQEEILRLKTILKGLRDNCLSCRKNWQIEKSSLASVKEERQKLFGTKDPLTEQKAAESRKNSLEETLAQIRIDHSAADTNVKRTLQEKEVLEKSVRERSEKLISARDLFLDACARAGVTEELFLQRVLTKDEMTSLAAEDAKLTTRKKQLAEEKSLSEKAVSDLEKMFEGQKSREKALAESETLARDIEEKNQTLGALQEKIRQNEEAKLRMADQHGQLLEQQKVMVMWQALYDLIGGEKFQRFAQGITLEHLLALANLELAKLTDRYQLLRSQTEELGIDVADKDQGDEIRSSKTLSGGERFLVSLALALGLSQMAGSKIRVDSLFLDEGFGTLDAETLDVALETLSSLRNRGKLVGVISHVSAFAEKIPCVIEVTKTGGGRSTLKGPGVRRISSKQ